MNYGITSGRMGPDKIRQKRLQRYSIKDENPHEKHYFTYVILPNAARAQPYLCSQPAPFGI